VSKRGGLPAAPLLEPDAVARGLSGEIVARFERRGFVLRGAPLLRGDRALAEQHSAEQVEKQFLGKLVDFITSSPTLAFMPRVRAG
jgi:nucleoside-diphosphate kinase